MLGLNKVDNNTFDLETLHIYTLSMNKREYNAMERDINKYEDKGAGFTIYAWNDVSGYEYWTIKQEENNYIQITARIDNPNVDMGQVHKALQKAYDYFTNKYEVV